MNFNKFCELLKAEAIEFKKDYEWDNDQWNDSYIDFKDSIARSNKEWVAKHTPEELAIDFAREFYQEASVETHDYWPIQKDGDWYKASVTKPPVNMGVLVYIPEKSDHVTSGMWDLSGEEGTWVLLDENRKPTSQVTYWMWWPKLPEDQEYEATEDDEAEDELPENFINSEAKLILIGFIHSAQSTTNFTEYQKIINGVTWAYVIRSSGSDYLSKDKIFVCHVETWSLLNEALDEHKLRD